MRDADCIVFLQWALPRMGFRWPGFRKVRRQVCKRVGRRLPELGLEDIGAYREYLGAHREEWSILDGFCRITISRFFRDRKVFETLGREVLPELVHQAASGSESALGIWSAGCGAGEEPYSISILCRHLDDPDRQCPGIQIVATDADEHQLDRAHRAIYPVGSTREVPSEIRLSAFAEHDQNQLLLRDSYRKEVRFACQDLRHDLPESRFHLILCRNLAFTYFVEGTQRQILASLHQRLLPGGYLVIGAHEHLPADGPPFDALPHCPSILRRAAGVSSACAAGQLL